MTEKLHRILDEINALRTELESEMEQSREQFGWRVHDGLVKFEKNVATEHQKLRMGITSFLARSSLATILTAPVIYSLIIPFLLIDLWTTIYQVICFRAYGIPRVQRAHYIRLDRRKLRYLNWIEALNCTFCSYANGVIAYVREVASRTEKYWCPIKHALRVADPHERYHDFLEYGDAAGYRSHLATLRQALREESGQNAAASD